jgi:hypothetical protein
MGVIQPFVASCFSEMRSKRSFCGTMPPTRRIEGALYVFGGDAKDTPAACFVGGVYALDPSAIVCSVAERSKIYAARTKHAASKCFAYTP